MYTCNTNRMYRYIHIFIIHLPYFHNMPISFHAYICHIQLMYIHPMNAPYANSIHLCKHTYIPIFISHTHITHFSCTFIFRIAFHAFVLSVCFFSFLSYLYSYHTSSVCVMYHARDAYIYFSLSITRI